jgi:hypothetical protein
MLQKLSLHVRRHALVIVTGLVVAYVRSFLQYHRYWWTSVPDFLASWFVHYLAILLFTAISSAIIFRWDNFFLGNNDREKKSQITTDQATVYVSLVILMFAVSVFLLALLAHLPKPSYFNPMRY